MTYRQLFIKLALIFAETCFLVLLYICFLGLIKEPLPVAPLFFFILTGLLTTGNYLLNFMSLRPVTIIIINLLIIGLVVGLMLGQAGLPLSYLLKVPQGFIPGAKVVLIDCMVLWLAMRSLFQVYKRRPPNVYGHFDLYLLLTLAVFLTISISGVSLPGGMIWALTALYLNLLPLYIYNNSEETKSPFAAWFLGGLAAVLLYFASQTATVLAHVSEPAGTAFNFLKTAFFVLVRFFAQILAFLVQLMYGRRGVSSIEENHSSAGSEIVNGSAASDLPWLYTGLKILLAALAIIVLLIIMYTLYDLLRYAIFSLFKKRKGSGWTRPPFNPFLSWKRIYCRLREFFKKITGLLRPFLPFKMSVQQAYSLLLRWGSSKRLARGLQETPYSYCRRLAEKYPHLSPQLQKITDAFVLYRYAQEKQAIASDPSLKKTIRKIYLADFYRFLRK
ncbi:MAG: DUF4129 domain-containing protein [Peptococcaceae bacterium]|jgi:hypothetical protein|nr:DUF4129 domain-containing protein [Peptococcaceae bacterium]